MYVVKAHLSLFPRLESVGTLPHMLTSFLYAKLSTNEHWSIHGGVELSLKFNYGSSQLLGFGLIRMKRLCFIPSVSLLVISLSVPATLSISSSVINPMFGPSRSSSKSHKTKHQREEKEWLGVSFRPENFIPGLIIGFIFGLFLDLTKPRKTPAKISGKHQEKSLVLNNGDQELKMVLVVRQDLKMGAGKIASQCAHAATGLYAELMQSDQNLLRRWESCGQAKIVVTCKNQQEMNNLREAAESIGLPSFVVADAGRTQVLSGSKTVLAIGPGAKGLVDSVTGKLKLL